MVGGTSNKGSGDTVGGGTCAAAVPAVPTATMTSKPAVVIAFDVAISESSRKGEKMHHTTFMRRCQPPMPAAQRRDRSERDTRSASMQEKSTRYKLPAINFYLGETPTRERPGRAPASKGSPSQLTTRSTFFPGSPVVGVFLWNAIRPGRAAARTGGRASIEIDWATSQQHNIMIFD